MNNRSDKKYSKIVLISLDTLRADCIKENPDKTYPSEYDVRVSLQESSLDHICSRAFFFNNAISAAPYTSTSHAAYFTGLWPKNNGLYDQFNSKLSNDVKTIFQMAVDSGYHTIFKTDFPFVLGKYLNLIGGVQKYFVEDDRSALDELNKHENVFAFFHFGQIHYPYGFHSLKYAGKDYTAKVERLERQYGIEHEKMDLKDMAVETFRDGADLELLYRYKKIISHLYQNRLDSDLFNLYLEGINYFHTHKFNHFLDDLLNRLQNDNYLIIIFGDHGEAWNNHTYGHHNSLDDGVIRVPMMFHARDISPGLYRNRIRTIDLAPTLNDLVFHGQHEFDGISLSNIIRGNECEPDRDAFSAVWVNKSPGVVENIRDLLATDEITTTASKSVKFAACLYQGQFKYVRRYMKFLDRESEIVTDNTSTLLRLDGLHQLPVENQEICTNMERLVNKYNTILSQNNLSSSEQLKKYFNIQGYRI